MYWIQHLWGAVLVRISVISRFYSLLYCPASIFC